MTIIARPNRDALDEAIGVYRDAMRPFILRSLRRIQGVQVEERISQSLPDRQAENLRSTLDSGVDLESALDVNYFPAIISNRYNWRDVFSQALAGDKTTQNELWLINDARNQVSHPGIQDLEDEYTRTHLFHIADVLGKINAPELKKTVEMIRDSLTEPADKAADENSVQPALDDEVGIGEQPEQKQQPRANGNLRPWREVIRPNQDIAQGSFQQAEFMAELQQVHDGRADTTQYGNPVSFFEHTYITPGIRALLVNSLKRLNAAGGDPVIQTKTGFGGGKTHSLIALYHLVKNADALLNPQPGADSDTAEQIRSILDEAGYTQNPEALGEIAVLDGTYLAPTDQKKTEAGDPLNTLWGVMAYGLGKQPAYDIIGESARRRIAPGGAQLDELFDYIGPCVLLIDEIVNYIRNAGDAKDNIYTFVQNLTQSVRRSKDAIMVITLPQSRAEAGGESGAEAMDRLENILARIDAVWEPLAVNETFEVVRRRLFGPVIDEQSMNQTCETFARMYSNNRREYPQGTAEQNYLERMKSCYPIHPEIFDRLYSDWSSIQNFQRTRGVLRMLSTCVSRLYLGNNPNYMIMPADIPLSDETLADEFIRLQPGNWRPVVSEVDSNNSRTDNIDKESQRYGEVGGAARRVARTIFLGSAVSGATRGIDQRQIHLGTVQPGQGVSLYNEALGRMVGDLYYLYDDNNRYFFHAEENLNKVVNDRADALSDKTIDDHIAIKLQEIRNRRGDVILYNGDTSEVLDTDSVRLVVLPPGVSLPTRSQEIDTAGPEAIKIVNWRGNDRRTRRNTLLFLTAKRDEIRNLRNDVKKYLAWDSILNGITRLPDLTGDRRSLATANIRSGESSVRTAFVRAYCWALAPVQRDPQKAEYEVNTTHIEATDSGEIIERTFNKLSEEEALVDYITPAVINSTLREYIWDREDVGDHVSINYVWNLLTNNVYMHRLRNKTVLLNCLKQGIEQGLFGYATNHDGEQYNGILIEEPITDSHSLVDEGNIGLLVRTDAAARQKDQTRTSVDLDSEQIKNETDEEDPTPCKPTPPRGPRHITARKTIAGDFSLDEINILRENIIRNLSQDGGEITIGITISARKADGFTENITRSVRENSFQLGLAFNVSDDE